MRRRHWFRGSESELILRNPSFALVKGFTSREVELEPVTQLDGPAVITMVPEMLAREVRIADLFVRSRHPL